jgi:hypothetical protein
MTKAETRQEVARRLNTAHDDIARARNGWTAALDLLHESTGGYPSGGGGAPSGTSDRTARLATGKRDPALAALDRLNTHSRRLMTLCGHPASPVDLIAAHVTIARTRTDLTLAADWHPYDAWAESLMDVARALAGLIGEWQPAARPDPTLAMCDHCRTREKAEDRTLCPWCHSVKHHHGNLPDRKLIELKARRDRLTTADMTAFDTRMIDNTPRKTRKSRRRKANA